MRRAKEYSVNSAKVYLDNHVFELFEAFKKYSFDMVADNYNSLQLNEDIDKDVESIYYKSIILAMTHILSGNNGIKMMEEEFYETLLYAEELIISCLGSHYINNP